VRVSISSSCNASLLSVRHQCEGYVLVNALCPAGEMITRPLYEACCKRFPGEIGAVTGAATRHYLHKCKSGERLLHEMLPHDRRYSPNARFPVKWFRNIPEVQMEPSTCSIGERENQFLAMLSGHYGIQQW
jgi:hypothetical protein